MQASQFPHLARLPLPGGGAPAVEPLLRVIPTGGSVLTGPRLGAEVGPGRARAALPALGAGTSVPGAGDQTPAAVLTGAGGLTQPERRRDGRLRRSLAVRSTEAAATGALERAAGELLTRSAILTQPALDTVGQGDVDRLHWSLTRNAGEVLLTRTLDGMRRCLQTSTAVSTVIHFHTFEVDTITYLTLVARVASSAVAGISVIGRFLAGAAMLAKFQSDTVEIRPIDWRGYRLLST